jgi:hypothetical protein
MGIHYAELPNSDILKPEWLAEVHRVLPEIEKSTEVKIRFMASLWRHSDPSYHDIVIQKIISLLKAYLFSVGRKLRCYLLIEII